MKHIFVVLLSFTLLGQSNVHASCVGRFVNPLTDICWRCLFPLTIAGVQVSKGEDTPSPKQPLCHCKNPPRVGIPISFWEPVRLVDVTRTPYCMVNLGGITWDQSLGCGVMAVSQWPKRVI